MELGGKGTAVSSKPNFPSDSSKLALGGFLFVCWYYTRGAYEKESSWSFHHGAFSASGCYLMLLFITLSLLEMNNWPYT